LAFSRDKSGFFGRILRSGAHTRPKDWEERRLSVSFAVVLVLTALAMMYCVCFREVSAIGDSPYRMLYLVAVVVLVFFFIYELIMLAYLELPRLKNFWRGKNPLKRLSLEFNARSIAVSALVVLVCWIPWILAQYPCGMSNDTYEQLYEFQTSSPTYYYTLGIMVPESYIDHHPVFDTLVFGAFWSIGDAVGDQNIGLFVYSLFQCVGTAAALAASCCYLERLGASKPLRLLCLAFVAFFPCIPQYATAMLKDSLFSMVFVPFLIIYIEAFRTRGACLKKKSLLIWLVVFACLCMFTKKLGTIIVVVSLIVLAIWCKGYRVRTLGSLVAALLVCFALVPATVYPAIGGVAPGGKQEAFGVLMQQVTVAARQNDDLTESEREAVNAVFDLEQAKQNYVRSTVDKVKNKAHAYATTGDYLRFLGAYITIGIRHIPDYTFAVFDVSASLICPGTGLGYYGTPNQESWRIEPIIEHDVNNELNMTFSKPDWVKTFSIPMQSAYSAVVKSPLGSLLFGVGMFGGWIPLLCLALGLRGGRRYWVAFAPIFVSVLLLLLSPADPTRYVLPMMYAIPLMAGLVSSSIERWPWEPKPKPVPVPPEVPADCDELAGDVDSTQPYGPSDQLSGQTALYVARTPRAAISEQRQESSDWEAGQATQYVA
jgi:hypothetical protein